MMGAPPGMPLTTLPRMPPPPPGGPTIPPPPQPGAPGMYATSAAPSVPLYAAAPGGRPGAPLGRPAVPGYMSPPAVGGAGDLDQPLADKFRALTIMGGPGGSQVAPEELPRPSADELSHPMRWDARGEAAANPGQCHPQFIRMTVNSLPNSPANKSRTALPLGAIITPLARCEEAPVPVVNFGAAGVVRCRRCRTYINAFVSFIDNGRRWRCNVCSLANDCPPSYICDLDHTGQRRDRMERPELHCGAVEFVAPAEYMVRPPQPPVFLFLIDVSYQAVASGMLRCVAVTLRHSLDRLPGGERTQVGLITYDSTLHFYNLNGSTAQMLVVAELEEPFVPMPGEVLVNLSERKDVLVALLEKLPDMFASNQTTETSFGPALQAAFQASQHVGGKLAVFTASRPTLGEGKLVNREGGGPAGVAGGGRGGAANSDAKAGGGMLAPSSEFYKNFAVDCSKQQLCVDIWNCNGSYADLATIGQLAKHTGGTVYHLPGFNDSVMGEKLSRDLQHNLTRDQGLEAVMRVRASRGLRIASFHGHFFIRGVDLLALPNVDQDKSFAVEIAHEENELGYSSACLQAALLYTTTCGERRIRVMTLELPVTSALSNIFESADVDACVALTARLAAEAALATRPMDGAEKLQNACLEALRAYRSLCPPAAKTTNQFLVPDSLRLLPLYTLAAMKSVLYLGPADARADERSQLVHILSTASPTETTVLCHPRLFQVFPPVERLSSGLPIPLPLTGQAVHPNCAYILDDTCDLSLWIGRGVPAEFVQPAFGWASLEGVEPSSLRLLPPDSSPTAADLHSLVDAIRAQHTATWMPLRVLKQGVNDAPLVRALVEDQTKQMMSYPEFMLHCHRYVLSKA